MLEIENTWIPLKDGRNLAARIWLPDDAIEKPVPAILEYLPYRKRDGTASRDHTTYPQFAAAGYAGIRVDISGTGESDGDYDDEYSPREHADGLEVIEWIAQQEWCDGNLGMMGISWGGFNSLQLAALKPSPLKAIIAVGTTVDRYNDDIHYKNGCHLYANFMWSSTMLCFASRPPDPALVGDQWKEMWLHRLQTQPFPLETWLSHQTRDEYWKHGSVCEDYENLKIPALVISGWGDGYINAPPAMAANSPGVCQAINGPWIHKYPHFAWPKPRMNFISEATKWWDRWLKGKENNEDDNYAYHAYISENVRPGGYRDFEPGRWVGEKSWPSENIRDQIWYPGCNRCLRPNHGEPNTVSICSPQDTGIACGEVFTLKPDCELPGDQRYDDGGSLVFEAEVLEQSLDILGRPRLSLRISIDRPIGNLAVRLCDVHPDGPSHRVSWGVLNLAHRNSNEFPEPMEPGVAEQVEIVLDECGYRFLPGHRIRVCISTAYWPMVMPPPEVVTANIELGSQTFLELPYREGDDSIVVSEPSDQNPLPKFRQHLPPAYERMVTRELHTNLTHFRVFDDTGEDENSEHGMRIRHTHEEVWTISPDDPLLSSATSTYTCYMSRGDWNITTVSESLLYCDLENYYLTARVNAFEGSEEINQRTWNNTIRRNYQ